MALDLHVVQTDVYRVAGAGSAMRECALLLDHSNLG